MTTPLQSLVASGTTLWLDSVDPDEVRVNREWGATGATSNPKIIADLINTGRFDSLLTELFYQNLDDEGVAWRLTDHLVSEAEKAFLPAWEESKGETGWVSFELDPLLEDPDRNIPVEERTRSYVELAKRWSEGHPNRMIKVPNTDGGAAALEEVVAAGVPLNVTLTFTERQYKRAREACWRGAQRRPDKDRVKTVYSIFVSRIDVYTAKHVPDLSPAAQGMVGIVNAKRIWRLNQEYWRDKGLPLRQQIVFASTGTKKPEDPPWKYVEAFAGSDIETNPPATNRAVQESGRTFTRKVDQMPPEEVLQEIDRKVDMLQLEEVLMREGVKKFADPMKNLLALIARKRSELPVASEK
ncbi:MAG TPA: transaldolase family protein [Gemmataceae bacterium]